jgi:hypothetical protein
MLPRPLISNYWRRVETPALEPKRSCSFRPSVLRASRTPRFWSSVNCPDFVICNSSASQQHSTEAATVSCSETNSKDMMMVEPPRHCAGDLAEEMVEG